MKTMNYVAMLESNQQHCIANVNNKSDFAIDFNLEGMSKDIVNDQYLTSMAQCYHEFFIKKITVVATLMSINVEQNLVQTDANNTVQGYMKQFVPFDDTTVKLKTYWDRDGYVNDALKGNNDFLSRMAGKGKGEGVKMDTYLKGGMCKSFFRPAEVKAQGGICDYIYQKCPFYHRLDTANLYLQKTKLSLDMKHVLSGGWIPVPCGAENNLNYFVAVHYELYIHFKFAKMILPAVPIPVTEDDPEMDGQQLPDPSTLSIN